MDWSIEGQSKAKRAVTGGGFGATLAVLTGSTPIGIALVAAIGAGLALKYRSRNRQQG